MMTQDETFTVHVQDNYDHESNYKCKGLKSYEEALTLCKKIVDEFLIPEFAKDPPESAEKIMGSFWGWGEAPYIDPVPAGVTSFSAQTYLEERCREYFASREQQNK
jgi:hypothetical protein